MSSSSFSSSSETAAEHDAVQEAILIVEQLAQSMLRDGDLRSWAYLILQWNLISRKCNIQDIHFNIVRWSHDMMTILFCHTKTQHGTRKDVQKISFVY